MDNFKFYFKDDAIKIYIMLKMDYVETKEDKVYYNFIYTNGYDIIGYCSTLSEFFKQIVYYEDEKTNNKFKIQD